MSNLNNENQDMTELIIEEEEQIEKEDEQNVNKFFPNPNENKITLHETIDGAKLRYIVDHAEEYEEQLIKSDSDEDWTLDRVVTILRKILRRCKKGVVKVNYKQNNKQGRYFGEGLQSLPRVVRHTIAKDFYHDVDIKNCHPVVLAHYCKTKGLEHTHLKKYVSNREDYFSLLGDECGMDRDSAKSFILAMINGKVITDDDNYPDEVIDFYNELLMVRERILELEPTLVKLGKKNLKKKGRNEDNLDGTVTNLLMCDFENRVLMEMYNFFHHRKVKVDVLVFDGLMVSNKNVTEVELRVMLAECEDYVFRETGIRMKLDIKPMDEGLDLPASILDMTYEAVKARFEEHNFKCIDKAGFFNMEHSMVRMKTKSDMTSAYEHLVYVNEDGKDQCFIRTWFKDPEMRKYEFVHCIPPPLKCDEHTYNLWDGFAIESEEKSNGDCQVLLNHIRLLCNNDDRVFDFVEKWLACLLQKPAYKNNVALLFKSKQGMGKDLFYTMLERMIGSKYCGNTSRPERDIFGDFNSFLHNKLLVVMNEFSGAIGFKYSDKLKDLITNLKEPIRKMRTDVSERDISFAHYMFFTNNEFPIKVERGDRRLFVSEVNQPIPPKDYFDRLVDVINKPQALRSLYDHLMSIDISGVDWIRDKPMTEYMNDLLESCTDREMTFLVNKIKQAEAEAGLEEQKEVEISSKQLLGEFRDDCLQNGYEYKTSPIKCGIKLKKYMIDGFSVKKTKKGNVYIFDTKRCVDWMIKQGYIDKNYYELDNNIPERLLNRQENDSEYEERKFLPPLD